MTKKFENEPSCPIKRFFHRLLPPRRREPAKPPRKPKAPEKPAERNPRPPGLRLVGPDEGDRPRDSR